MKKKAVKITLSIFLGISLIIFLVICAIDSVKREQKKIRQYIQDSDYYFSGTIIDNYPQADDEYYRCIIIKPDSIYIGGISTTGYMAAYNKELNEIVLSTGFSMYDKSGASTPSYVIVDSKRDTIIYDKSEGDPMSGLVPMRIPASKDFFGKVLYKRGGSWLRF